MLNTGRASATVESPPSAEFAQEVLRHQSIETTHESYRDDDVERLRDAAEDALGG